MAGGELPSLVFPELVEGDYELFDKGTDQVRLTVVVVGGEVAMATWPERRTRERRSSSLVACRPTSP